MKPFRKDDGTQGQPGGPGAPGQGQPGGGESGGQGQPGGLAEVIAELEKKGLKAEDIRNLQGNLQKAQEKLKGINDRIQRVREANPWASDWSDDAILDSITAADGGTPSGKPNPDDSPNPADDPAEAGKKQLQNVLGAAVGSSLHTRKYIDRTFFLQQNPELSKPENQADLEKLDKAVQDEIIRTGDPRKLGDANLYAQVRSRMISNDPAYADTYYQQRKAKEDQERAEKEKSKGASPLGGVAQAQAQGMKHVVETKAGPKSVKVWADEEE